MGQSEKEVIVSRLRLGVRLDLRKVVTIKERIIVPTLFGLNDLAHDNTVSVR